MYFCCTLLRASGGCGNLFNPSFTGIEISNSFS